MNNGIKEHKDKKSNRISVYGLPELYRSGNKESQIYR